MNQQGWKFGSKATSALLMSASVYSRGVGFKEGRWSWPEVGADRILRASKCESFQILVVVLLARVDPNALFHRRNSCIDASASVMHFG